MRDKGDNKGIIYGEDEIPVVGQSEMRDFKGNAQSAADEQGAMPYMQGRQAFVWETLLSTATENKYSTPH